MNATQTLKKTMKRFAFAIALTTSMHLSWASLAIAQTINLNASAKTDVMPRMQKGKRSALLKTTEGYSLETLAVGLGNISALSHDGKTHLYTADKESGRVWRLTDRNQDGEFESKQALPHRFDNPSGLAVSGDTLYVADKNAVWLVEGFLPPEILAGLRQANSKGLHHPLSLSSDNQNLLLGLTTHAQETKILSISLDDGLGTLLDETKLTEANANQSILALSMTPNGTPWIIMDHSLGTQLGNMTQFNMNQKITGIALPFSTNTEEANWSKKLPNNLIVSRQSPQGFDVLALPTNFGQAQAEGTRLLSGFLSTSGRTAWGAPSAIIFDQKGLVIADSFNGDLYRLSLTPKADDTLADEVETPSQERLSQTKINDVPPSALLSTITGSQIGTSSSINSGSNIKVGSSIVRDYKPVETDEESEETQSKKRPRR